MSSERSCRAPCPSVAVGQPGHLCAEGSFRAHRRAARSSFCCAFSSEDSAALDTSLPPLPFRWPWLRALPLFWHGHLWCGEPLSPGVSPVLQGQPILTWWHCPGAPPGHLLSIRSSWGLPGGYLIPHPGHVRFLEHKSASSTLRLQDFKFLGLGSEVVPFSLPLETLRGNKETPSPLSSLQFETFVLRGVLKQSIMTGYQVNTWNVSFSQSFGILTSIIWAHQSKFMLE